MNIFHTFTVILIAVSLSCRNGDSDADLQSENISDSLSSLDMSPDENSTDDDVLFGLDTARAGLFEIGMGRDDILEIASVYGDVTVEEVDLNLEGMYSPAIEITFPGESSPGLVLEIEPDAPGNVYRINVLSDRFRTEHGIGVSSTIAEIWQFYIFGETYCGEGGNPMILVYNNKIEFPMVLDPGDWWVPGEVQGAPSVETEVKAILII